MNNVLHFALVLLSVCLASYFLTGRVIRFAQQRQLFDLPNQRSSHSLPTPRGGGLAIVAVFFLANIYAFLSGLIAVNLCVALLGSGLMVAIVGWIDDHSHVAVHIRLAVQFAAAIWGMYWLGMFSAFAGIPLVARWLCYGFVLLYLVWVLNLYNFMDGINGIAGVEAITVCLGAILFIAVSGGFSNAIVIPSLLLFSVAGFLVWNFPSAKVFMGDVGSGFIGLTLALLSLNAATIKFEFFFGWLILLGIFIADATLTLLRRIFRCQRFYEAH